MSKKNAFTLVELLVVIAIIALLMSILMPALGRVRKQAKTVLCQSNLKQWGICFAMYVDDWDGYFMQGWIERDYEGAYRDYWMDALRACYGDAGDIRLCPMATKPGTELGLGEYGNDGGPFSAWGVFTNSWSYAVEGDYGSYGWNGWVGDPPHDVPPDLGQEHPVIWNWRKANVSGTGNIPLITANQWVDGWPRHDDSPPEHRGQPWGLTQNENMARFFQDRHDGSVNTAFLDWSVRRVGLKQLYKLKWHRKFDVSFLEPVWATEAPWAKNFKDYY